MVIAANMVLALVLAFAAPPDPQALEQTAKQLEAQLIAPCCWSQQVSVHQSAAADDIKQNIRVMLASGKTSQQVLDFYVAEYGDRILAEPPARGFNTSLYVLPWIFLAGSVGLVVVVIKHLRSPAPLTGATAAPAGELNEAEADRLDEELRNLE
jgi:cytochrome c-type biogenesis protein CcmH